MSDAAKEWRNRAAGDRAVEPVPRLPEAVALDGHRPRLIDDPQRAMRVTSGHVDIFAVPAAEGGPAGARRHLFRVESGGIILGLPRVEADGAAGRIDVLAVGGQAAEALVVDRRSLVDVAEVEAWIGLLSAAIATAAADRLAPPAEPGASLALERGERLAAPLRGLAWLTLEEGELRLMDAASTCRAGDPPLPLAAGAWVEAVAHTCVTVLGSGALAVPGLWPALDRFHALAMHCLQRRIAAAAQAERQRLDRRADLGVAQSARMLDELAGVIVPHHAAAGLDEDGGDALLAACRAVAAALGATLTRPPGRQPERRELSDIVEIARASRLRVRRTLLRPGWWRRDVGPLVAWHGEARHPIAIIPTARHRFVMVDPVSGQHRPIDGTLASELSAEAAMLYVPLPSRALSVVDLLRFCMPKVQSDLTRLLLAALAMGALTLAAPLITEALFDSVIPRTELDQLAYCALALAIVAIAGAGFQAAQSIAMLRLDGSLDCTLQAAILDRLLRLPVDFFRRYTVGDLTDRTLGIGAMRQVLTGRTIRGLLAGLLCVFSFALMFYYDVRLALIASALTAVRGSAILAVSAARLRHERLHFDLQGKVGGLVLQFLTGVGKLRVAAATVRALEVWALRFGAQKRHFTASQRQANILTVVEAAFPPLAALAIFAAAQHEAGGGLILDTGQFLAFFVAFGQSLAAVGEFGTAIGESLIAVPYFARVRPLISEPVEISEERKPPGKLSGAFELGRVTFRYVAGGPTILEKVTLRVARGGYVALVGPSGGGKSTIFRLLLGFERPESGTVLFDGKAIDTLDIGAVRRQIGVVLQNGKLTSGSIYENICGGVHLPFDQVWEAARHAGLAADIEAMPMGIHTMVAEGLSTFSGGQRQRLMIARALVHRPSILLFDEATSALDNPTQAIVSASLAKLNVTRLVIAHRLSTVEAADRIVVLVDGKIAESGTFAELMGSAGVFAEFAKRQLL
ncbi:MAG: NHLP bacteriocin export ABC transporter permease/ATPase subunit [Alphaproteobacteria bacterium]